MQIFNVTRRPNIWQFSEMKISPIAHKLCQSELKTLLQTSQSDGISPNLVTLNVPQS